MTDAAAAVGQAVAFPRPGAPYEPGGELPTERWWRPLTRPFPRSRETGGPSRSEETLSGDLDLAGDR